MVHKDHDSVTHTRRLSGLSRRKVLQTTGAGLIGTTVLSGCLGDDDDDDVDDDDTIDPDDDDDDDDDEPIELDLGGAEMEQQLAKVSYATLADFHWNIFNPANNAVFGEWFGGDFVYERPAVYYPGEDDWEGYLLDDWNIDGTTLTCDVSDEYVWHNGDDLTADDFVFQWQLTLWRDHADGHGTVADVHSVDEYTFELELEEEQNEFLTQLELLHQDENVLAAHPEHHQEFYDRFEDATDDDEMDEVVSDMMSYRVEEPIGNGILELTDRPEARFEFERFEDHPRNDDHDIDGVILSEIWQERANFHGEYPNIHVWGTGGCARHEELDDIWEPAEAPPFFSPTQEFLYVNNDHEYLGRTEFRKGLQELIDPEAMIEFTNLCAWEYDGTPTGLDETTQGNFVDGIDDFESYGPMDLDAAQSRFEAAGFEYDGDELIDEDGNQVGFEMIINDHASAHHGMSEVMRSLLEDVGVDLEITILEDTVHASRVVDGDFEMSPGGAGNVHPYLTYNSIFNGTIQGQIHLPDENEITPVGDPDGATETVNTADLASDLRLADGDELIEGVTQLAWWFNQNVPMITVYDSGAPSWMWRADLWDRHSWRTDDPAPDERIEMHTYYSMSRLGYWKWDPVDPDTLPHGHEHMYRDFH